MLSVELKNIEVAIPSVNADTQVLKLRSRVSEVECRTLINMSSWVSQVECRTLINMSSWVSEVECRTLMLGVFGMFLQYRAKPLRNFGFFFLEICEFSLPKLCDSQKWKSVTGRVWNCQNFLRCSRPKFQILAAQIWATRPNLGRETPYVDHCLSRRPFSLQWYKISVYFLLFGKPMIFSTPKKIAPFKFNQFPSKMMIIARRRRTIWAFSLLKRKILSFKTFLNNFLRNPENLSKKS